MPTAASTSSAWAPAGSGSPGDGLDTSLPYLRGRTELLDEPPGEAPGPAAGTVRALFDTYREALGDDRAGTDADDVPDDPRQLSYLVAATVVLDLTDRQRLLEAPDTTARLRARDPAAAAGDGAAGPAAVTARCRS